MIPAVKKAFTMLVDDNFELNTENAVLKEKIGDYDEKWLKESKEKMMTNTTDDAKKQMLKERMINQLRRTDKK